MACIGLSEAATRMRAVETQAHCRASCADGTPQSGNPSNPATEISSSRSGQWIPRPPRSVPNLNAASASRPEAAETTSTAR